MGNTAEMTIGQKAKTVLNLQAGTPDGQIRDADTILKDLMDEADFEISGTAIEIIGIWKASRDKDSIEALFQSFTGCPFQEWLDKCIAETTRNDP